MGPDDAHPRVSSGTEAGETALDVLVWSDYLCPWCYLALQRAEHLERQHEAAVTWLPYDLHPEIPEGGVAARAAYERLAPGRHDAFMSHLAGLADASGLPFNPPSHIPRTRSALEASEWARHEHPDEFPAFHRALFDAYWVDDRDLEQVDVLASVAAKAGVDPDAMTAAVTGGVARDNVDRSTALGQEVGVTGTPGWLIDGRVMVPGAQDTDVFDRVISRLRDRAEPR